LPFAQPPRTVRLSAMEMTPASKPETKGSVVMGDKSPKSVHKKSAQKQLKASAADQQKKKAAAAKQVVGRK
jgi:hypothetical protein